MDGLLNKYEAFCSQPNFLLLQEAMCRMQSCKTADRMRTAADSFYMMHFAEVRSNETNICMFALYIIFLGGFVCYFEAAESDRRMKCQRPKRATFVD